MYKNLKAKDFVIIFFVAIFVICGIAGGIKIIMDIESYDPPVDYKEVQREKEDILSNKYFYGETSDNKKVSLSLSLKESSELNIENKNIVYESTIIYTASREIQLIDKNSFFGKENIKYVKYLNSKTLQLTVNGEMVILKAKENNDEEK